MTIPFFFVMSLLVTFPLCMFVIGRLAKARVRRKDWRSWEIERKQIKTELHRLAELHSDRTWRGNKQMVMR